MPNSRPAFGMSIVSLVDQDALEMPIIQIISYDQALAAKLGDALSAGAHAVRVATPALSPPDEQSNHVQLVILDLDGADGTGHALTRRWRAACQGASLMALSANRDEADAVVAFRAGADHYVRKPVGLLELLARVEALLRRASAAARRPASTRFADIELDRMSNCVRRHGRVLPLSPMEFRLLDALVSRGGAVISRRELLEEVWRSSSDKPTRTIDLHVSQLRRKLDRDPRNSLVIETVWAHGYRLSIQARSIAS